MIPKAAPKATGIAVVLALLLCVAGVIVGRDALIAFGAVTGSPWIGPALNSIVDLTVQTWMLPVGIAVGVVGLVLVVAALLPRSRTHRRSDAEGVWLSRRSGRTHVSTMGRAAATADRLGTALFGLFLIALGTAAVAWQRDVLPDPIHDARRTFDTWSPSAWDQQGWWQWALAGIAVAAILLGLRWLFAHRPRRQRAQLTSDTDEHASVDLISAARHAAAEFAATPGIATATARVVEVKGSRLVRISGVADDSETPTADLVAAAASLRTMCASALTGLTVDTQVLIDRMRAPAEQSR
ncbi:hypothetical protein QMK17_10020 [Rhodococcus sp. G-MC3]|uniref:hypothetical protein n=1 Tax=Rhodococcus sp. G-MC3 TaxID=3046209 RepID=UPI0024BAC68F|nr:hypothetical protein [Rhodococcus sp. G-MC3]MDJ0393665.1 hypothetical protein [Rhodococcus sp. G-MC3]